VGGGLCTTSHQRDLAGKVEVVIETWEVGHVGNRLLIFSRLFKLLLLGMRLYYLGDG
jgi:hypothetical protein